jgi:hypothetical protein
MLIVEMALIRERERELLYIVMVQDESFANIYNIYMETSIYILNRKNKMIYIVYTYLHELVRTYIYMYIMMFA